MQDIRVKATLDITNFTQQTNQLNANVKRTIATMNSGTLSNKQYANSFNSLTKGLRSYISAYAGIHYGLKAVDTLRETEKGFIAIQKTTNMAGDEMDSFKEGLIDLANELKGTTVQELQDIATTAGQLGISGSENILSFSKAIAKIAVATDLTAESASQGFARITNIMGVTADETESYGDKVSRLGSVMNELSNTTTATASDIVAYSYRLAGSAKTLGLTTDQVFALSATLRDIGTRVEGGGTAMSRLMNMMIQDTESFAYYSNKTLEQYQRDIETKPIKAIQDLIASLGELDKEAKMEALKQLGITSEETIAVMLKLTTAQETLTKNLKTAKEELAENSSLQREYDLASKSLDSAIKDLNDSFVQLMITLGQDLIPYLKEWIDDIISGVDATKEFYEENRVLIRTLAELAKVVAGLYLVRKVFTILIGGEAVGALGSLVASSKNANQALLNLGVGIASLRKKVMPLLTTFSRFGIIGAVLGGALYYIEEMQVATEKAEKATKSFNEAYENSAKIAKSIQDKINKDGNFTGTTAEREEAIVAIQKLIDKNQEYRKELRKNRDEVSDNREQIIRKENAELAELNRTVKLATVIGDGYGKLLDTFSKKYNEESKSIEMTKTQLEEYIKKVDDSIKAKQDDIASLEENTEHLEINKGKIKQIQKEIELLTDAREKSAKATATVELKSRGLFQSELEEIAKLEKGYKRRAETHENSLNTMKKQEQTLQKEVIELQKELAEIIQKYQDKRVQAIDSMNDKIRNAEQKGMNDIQKYRDDQLTAEKKYSNAVSNFKKGNYEEAKRYLDEYYSLIENYAGEEITTEKEIQKWNKEKREFEKETIEQVHATRSQTLAEYMRDIKKGNAFELELNEALKQKEIEAQNEKIALKVAELNIVKEQMKVQIQMVEMFNALLEKLTGAKTNIDLSEAKKSIGDFESQIDVLKGSLENIKVGANTDSFKKEMSSIGVYGKKTINNVEVNVTADTTPADFGIEKLITKTEGTETSIAINPLWKEAENELDRFRKGEEKDEIEQKLVANTSEYKTTIKSIEKPTNKDIKLQVKDNGATIQIRNLTKPETKHITIVTHNVSANSNGGYISGYATGGLIQKYADGGFTRQTDKIAGHDLTGKDDVKALLTRGEFVQNVRAVDYYGVDFMRKINSMQIPKHNLPRYATGGLVAPKMSVPRYADGGLVQTPSGINLSDKVVNVNFNVGNQSFGLFAEEQIADSLARLLERGEF